MSCLWRSVLVLVSVSHLVACGDDGGVAKPRAVEEGASSDPGDITPEVGICRKLCCSDADCGASLACTPFDSASGTLGVCAGGSDIPTSADPPAGSTLPESCFSPKAGCNALSSEGCAAGYACDYAAGAPDVEPVVSCFSGDNIQAEAESCDNALGPWCQPGWHCVTE